MESARLKGSRLSAGPVRPVKPGPRYMPGSRTQQKMARGIKREAAPDLQHARDQSSSPGALHYNNQTTSAPIGEIGPAAFPTPLKWVEMMLNGNERIILCQSRHLREKHNQVTRFHLCASGKAFYLCYYLHMAALLEAYG